jgi:hypothetical protein
MDGLKIRFNQRKSLISVMESILNRMDLYYMKTRDVKLEALNFTSNQQEIRESSNLEGFAGCCVLNIVG